MAIYKKDSRLADALRHVPDLIPVINRFGIRLGVGDAAIEAICNRHGVDPEFFLAMVNTFVNADFFPEQQLRSFSVDATVEYLTKTDEYYRDVQLPNIERHFAILRQRSSAENESISLLLRFFMEMKSELLARIDRDATHWFPALRRCSDADLPVIREFVAETSAVEDKLNDLCQFFIVHLRGAYDENLCMAVVSALFSLGRDIRQNDRIRDRILKPIAADRLTRYSD